MGGCDAPAASPMGSAGAASPRDGLRRAGAQHQEQAVGDHRQRQDLAHGGGAAEEIAKLGVGLAEELDDDAAQPVADEERPAQPSDISSERVSRISRNMTTNSSSPSSPAS